MAAFTSRILMIRPACFGFNPQTAASNAFQKNPGIADADIQRLALREFDDMVALLHRAGIQVEVIADTPEPCKPDAVFPNNWISFHEQGEVVIYPMMAVNRRLEKRKDMLELLKQRGYQITKLIDLSAYETQGKFLEGTGSMVLDRSNGIIYACLSDRTDADLLQIIAHTFSYQQVSFHASDEQHHPIYHTNVMMAIGNQLAVVCAEAIKDEQEKQYVMERLHAHHQMVVEITMAQMHQYAGNVLYLVNQQAEPVIVMSATAYSSLTAIQRKQLESCGQLVLPHIPVIEQTGGGSVRCMIAELFLPYHRPAA
ncbi:MAG: amidinotransferase [Thermoflavifilum sp.]|nr:amidinotransferase [Thermoflavifilum sp.]